MENQNDRSSSQPPDAQPTPDSDEAGDLASSASRRRRSWGLGIGAAGALVLAATMVAIATGGFSTAGASETAQAKEIGTLLAGIPQNGKALGSPTAPVTMQFFGDLQCPTARAFTLEMLPSITREWVRPGTVRIEFRSLRSVSEPEAFGTQQAAALAAGTQDKLWEYLEYFYREQGPENSGYVTESYLASLARRISGLNIAQWSRERYDSKLATQVIEDEEVAHATHLSGTPSFLIGPTGSAPLSSLGESSSLEEIDNAVRHALRGQRAS